MKHANKLMQCVVSSSILLTAATSGHAGTWDPNSRASNTGGVVNTRHNLTMSYMSTVPSTLSTMPNKAAIMDVARNNYGEVCVYCHTPHGGNAGVQAPLWNRTINITSYTVYSGTLASGQTVTQPGASSLMCLSCHDGTIAIDSVINMPGSGNYLSAQTNTVSDTFLDTWSNASGRNTTTHAVMHTGAATNPTACLSCHTMPDMRIADADDCVKCHQKGAHSTSRLQPFDAFAVGTDLRNDHPIGVVYPSALNGEFKMYSAALKGNVAFFEQTANGRPDGNEVRLYNSGDGYEVECATCHDPHGVPSAGTGSLMIPGFLRVDNSQSALCQTCHTK